MKDAPHHLKHVQKKVIQSLRKEEAILKLHIIIFIIQRPPLSSQRQARLLIAARTPISGCPVFPAHSNSEARSQRKSEAYRL